jgi:hypothetical protein
MAKQDICVERQKRFTKAMNICGVSETKGSSTKLD